MIGQFVAKSFEPEAGDKLGLPKLDGESLQIRHLPTNYRPMIGR